MDKALEELLNFGSTALVAGTAVSSMMVWGVIPFLNSVREYTGRGKSFASIWKSQYSTKFPYFPKM